MNSEDPFFTFFELQSFCEQYHSLIIDSATISPKPLLSFFKEVPFLNVLSKDEYRHYVIIIMTKILEHNKDNLFKTLFNADFIDDDETKERMYETAEVLRIVGENMPWAFANFFRSMAGNEFKTKMAAAAEKFAGISPDLD